MRMQGTEARMRVSFGDVAGFVLRLVEVGTDEYSLAACLALGAEIGKTQDFLLGLPSRQTFDFRSPGHGGLPAEYQVQRQVDAQCRRR
jgi:hypothetical protein